MEFYLPPWAEKGVWLPPGERHLQEWMDTVKRAEGGYPTYQFHKLEAALKFCRSFRTAVDIGAHAGLWSMHLQARFAKVEAFEPVAAHRECFRKNVSELGLRVELWPMALGDRHGAVQMQTGPSSSGDTWVSGDDPDGVPLRRLDDLLADRDDIDFVKLDCEGYEVFALKGAESMLRRCKPAICVEQKEGHGAKFGISDLAAVDYLKSLGYRVRGGLQGDFFLTWD